MLLAHDYPMPFAAMGFNKTARPLTSQGTALTLLVGSKSNWVETIAATSADSFAITIIINGNFVAPASPLNTAIDIGIGAPGAEQVLFSNLLCGSSFFYDNGGIYYFFPLFIPAGSRISVRGQSTASSSANVYLKLQQLPTAAVKYASYVETLGVTVPAGTDVIAGTVNDGDWTFIGTLTKSAWHFQYAIQGPVIDTDWAANIAHVDIAIGDGIAFNIVSQDNSAMFSSSEIMRKIETLSINQFAPAGSDLYARIQASQIPDPYQIAIYAAGG